MNHRVMALCIATLLVVAGCTSKSGTTSTGGAAAAFTLSEFKVVLDGSLPAGPVNIKIDNQGGEKHEVVLVAAKDANALPKKADGSVDEDKIPQTDKIGESGDVAARTSTTKSFTLKSGTYIAFCNIVDDMGMTGSTMMGTTMMGGGSGGPAAGSAAGHVHFAQGMFTTFTVK